MVGRHATHGPQPYRKPVAQGFVVKQIAWAMAAAGQFTIHVHRHARLTAPRVLEFW